MLWFIGNHNFEVERKPEKMSLTVERYRLRTRLASRQQIKDLYSPYFDLFEMASSFHLLFGSPLPLFDKKGESILDLNKSYVKTDLIVNLIQRLYIMKNYLMYLVPGIEIKERPEASDEDTLLAQKEEEYVALSDYFEDLVRKDDSIMARVVAGAKITKLPGDYGLTSILRAQSDPDWLDISEYSLSGMSAQSGASSSFLEKLYRSRLYQGFATLLGTSLTVFGRNLTLGSIISESAVAILKLTVAQLVSNLALSAVNEAYKLGAKRLRESNPKLFDVLILSGESALRKIKNQNEDICLVVVHNDGLALRAIESQTELIIKVALRQNGEALRYAKHQTEDIRIIAITQNWHAYRLVNVQTRENSWYALKCNPHALGYIKNKEEDMIAYALQVDGLTLQHVDEQSPEMCRLAIGNTFHALFFVKDQTEDLIDLAFAQDIQAFGYVRDQNQELCLKYLEKNVAVLQYIVKQTRELAQFAIEKDPEALQYVKHPFVQTEYTKIIPEDRSRTVSETVLEVYDGYQDDYEDLCVFAIKKDWRAIKHVRYLTKKVCAIAIGINPEAKKFVIPP